MPPPLPEFCRAATPDDAPAMAELMNFAGKGMPLYLWSKLTEAGLPFKVLERFKDKPVIVSCATGNRSGSAASVLRKHGFTNVVNLAGGVAAWQQAGLPTGK